MIHYWTKEEIEELKILVELRTNPELAHYYKVSIDSIESVLKRNKIKRSKETRRKIRSEAGKQCHINSDRRGKNNPNWRGGIAKDNYHYKKIQMERYPEKVKARVLTHRAIRNGTLKKGLCEICNSADVHAHHGDYSKPLEIRWFCRKHHREHMHDNKS